MGHHRAVLELLNPAEGKYVMLSVSNSLDNRRLARCDGIGRFGAPKVGR